MRMEFSFGIHTCSILQVAALVVCLRGNVSGAEIAQGCIGSRLSLRCPEMKVIQITDVVLGDSNCLWGSCCIKDNDCTYNANASHRTDVHRRCDNKQSCIVDVFKEGIPCGALDSWSNNDFERITYNCRDKPEEMVEDCVGSRLSLRCEEMKVIKVIAVVLGESYGTGTYCYIRDNDCTHNANANHTMDVRHSCDGQRNCAIDVLQEKIPCGHLGFSSNNDFERITYICIDGPRNNTMNSADNYHFESADKSGEEQSKKSDNSATFGIVIACVVSLIVIIAIVASVVTVRRKKRQQVKSSDVVKMSDPETDRKEAIYTNEAQGISLDDNAGSTIPIHSKDNSKEVETSLNSGAKNLETPASEYCELQCESKYLQLYEPIIVHEQPQVEKSLNSGENPTSDYCELEGVARGGIQCDSDYLQLYESLIVNEQPQ